MDELRIEKDNIEMLRDARFIKLTDLHYAPGKHYFEASRRSIEDMACVKTDEEFKRMLPDAVTSFVIVKTPEEEERLVLFYEYRYPAGRFLLSPVAGLIDPADRDEEEPLFTCAKREIFEETGIRVKPTDKMRLIAPFVFSTPGLSDESNALVCAVVQLEDLTSLTQKGAEGSELFRGFELLTKSEASKVLGQGRDRYGNFFSAFTWMALTYFVTDTWKTEK